MAINPTKVAVPKKAETKKMEDSKVEMPFGKKNYKFLLIGVGLIALGFLLMVGGKSTDPNVFNEEIFSFRRITLAPILILAGFVVEIYAIMLNSQKEEKV
jgi:hypothetical protein